MSTILCRADVQHTSLQNRLSDTKEKKGNRDSAHRQRVTCSSSCSEQRVSTNAHCALGETFTAMSTPHISQRARECHVMRQASLACKPNCPQEGGASKPPEQVVLHSELTTTKRTVEAMPPLAASPTDAQREFAKTTNSNGTSSMRASSGSNWR